MDGDSNRQYISIYLTPSVPIYNTISVVQWPSYSTPVHWHCSGLNLDHTTPTIPYIAGPVYYY